MTKEKVLKNLKDMIGEEFDYDEIVCAFENFTEFGETDIIVSKTQKLCGSEHDYVEWSAYIDTNDSTKFFIVVDDNNIIVDASIMTKEKVLKNLKDMIGEEFDYDEIVCAFENFTEFGETDIIVSETQVICNYGHYYTEWSAYINVDNSTQFVILVDDDDNTIVDVRIYRDLWDWV